MLKVLKFLIPNPYRTNLRNKFFYTIRKIALQGTNVFCPVCQKPYLTFLPFGVKKRANAQCPNCLSLERHRRLWLFLKNKTNFLQSTLKLLHVSPNVIFFNMFQKLSNIDYLPVDKFDKKQKYQGGITHMDITNIDASANTFDVILCNHVLEHIPKDQKAMQELHRVLKPSGWAILQVPLNENRKQTYEDFSITDPEEREKAFGQSDHVRIYGQDYKDRLEKAGFEVSVIPFANKFSEEEQFKYGLMPNEKIYYCQKTKA